MVVYSRNIGVPPFRENQNAKIHIYGERLEICVTKYCPLLNDFLDFLSSFFLSFFPLSFSSFLPSFLSPSPPLSFLFF